MVNVKKPGPLNPVRPRRLCPVCGKVSYSPAGEHPQCALTRADAAERANPKLMNARKSKNARVAARAKRK
jgi:hypothetical protein